MSDSLDPRAVAVFRSIFEEFVGPVHRGLDASMVRGWDSVRHANLIMAMEEEFGRPVDLLGAFTCSTFGELVDMFVQCGIHE
jgi:acyl carrier protein